MKKINLTKGLSALVDDDDYDWLNSYCWHASVMGHGQEEYYAQRNIRLSSGKQTRLKMHRAILERALGRTVLIGKLVDHINRNPLDNRKSNLRICSASENQYNSVGRIHNKSGLKGAQWNQAQRNWRAIITVDKKRKLLGSFATAKEAASAYDRAARIYHKEFARLNFSGASQ